MEINIFASSDVHGYIDNYDYATNKPCPNSLASISSAYKSLDLANKILVDNGDMIQGNFIGNFNENIPHPAINIMNKMNYSIWNLGNHEFNYGVKNLKNVINQFNNDTLMANSNDEFFKPYTIINIEGINIGFIGINTPLINKFESKEALNGLVITDPVCELEKNLNILKNRTDAIIGLFHLGLKDENAYLNSGIISIIDNLKNPNLIDVIIGGHTHKEIHSEIYKDILITQPSVYAKSLSHINLKFNDKKLEHKESKLINIENYKPDPEIIKYFEPFHKEILSYTHTIIGYVENANEDVNVDLEDTSLKHLITDIMLSYSKADVVAFQIDNPKAVLKNGPITRADMANLYSYAGGEVSEYIIKGKDLKTYMEWSASYYDKINNQIVVNDKRKAQKYKTFDLFGNIKYEINLDFEKGNRVKNLKYKDNSPILDDDNILIALNEYRMNFLISEKGPLSGKDFVKLRSSKYIDQTGHKRGTIRGELAENFFKNLKNKTYIAKNYKDFILK